MGIEAYFRRAKRGEEGLKHESSIRCDDLTRIEKSRLTNYVGRLSSQKLEALNRALAIALELLGPDEVKP